MLITFSLFRLVNNNCFMLVIKNLFGDNRTRKLTEIEVTRVGPKTQDRKIEK